MNSYKIVGREFCFNTANGFSGDNCIYVVCEFLNVFVVISTEKPLIVKKIISRVNDRKYQNK